MTTQSFNVFYFHFNVLRNTLCFPFWFFTLTHVLFRTVLFHFRVFGYIPNIFLLFYVIDFYFNIMYQTTYLA